MKLIKASYQILTPIDGEEILKQIELAARTCYQSEGKIEYGRMELDSYIHECFNPDYATSARVLIPKLMSLNHEAMLEFGGMITVRFIVDRGVTHELVRHRLSSFAQESTRYVNYSKDGQITFIKPLWMDNIQEGEHDSRKLVNEINNIPIEQNFTTEEWKEITFLQSCAFSEISYLKLIDLGQTPQQARGILTNSLKSEINVSANIREWRHIMKLRTAKAAHPQMREVMCPLLDEFKSKIPILFDDINY